MKIKYLVFLFTAITFPSSIKGLFHRCPPKEILQETCSCSKDKFLNVAVVCQGMKYATIWQRTLANFRDYVIDTLEIRKSGAKEIIPGVFSKLNIHKLVLSDVEVHALPMFTFLNGLHETLEELKFSDVKVSEWIWERGTHFAFLRTIEFQGTRLQDVMTNYTFSVFPNNIRHIKLKGAGIKSLKDFALKKFAHLGILDLADNALATYERRNLPLPAHRLKHLSLSNNPLKYLPVDAFIQMKRLEFLFLSVTHLTSLHQETFKPVWEQLEEIYFNNIYLNCDCNSTWLLDAPKDRMYRPPLCKNLKGENRLLSEVKHSEICPHI